MMDKNNFDTKWVGLILETVYIVFATWFFEG